jgi:hypothetical protein
MNSAGNEIEEIKLDTVTEDEQIQELILDEQTKKTRAKRK